MRFDLNSEIRYPSGERAGVLRKVILNAKNEIGVVVMATSAIASRDVIVPAKLLYEGDGGVTYINATPDDVDEMRDYEEGEVPAIPEGWVFGGDAQPIAEVFPATAYQPIIPVMEVSNVGGAALTITQGTEIWCLDEPWGRVDELTSDDQGQIQALIGLPDDIEEHKLLIPIGLVSEADANRVVLNCTREDLPTYTQEVVNYSDEPDQE
jgi:hypothetical protein